MRKSRIISACVAVAALALPSVASAGVERQCTSVPTTKTVATFTAVQPANQYHQWSDLWTHQFTVDVNPDGTFSGVGVQDGSDSNGTQHYTQTITGTFTDDPADTDDIADHVSYVAKRSDGVVHTLANAPMNDDPATHSGTITVASVFATEADYIAGKPLMTQDLVEFKVSSSFLTTVSGDPTDYATHGEYVDAMGGGKIAAQKCVGMPVKSQAPKKSL